MKKETFNMKKEEDVQELIATWNKRKIWCEKTYSEINEDISKLKDCNYYSPTIETIFNKNFKMVYNGLDIYTNKVPQILETLKGNLSPDSTLTPETFDRLCEVVKEAKAWRKKFVQLKKVGKDEILFWKLRTAPKSTRVVDITDPNGRFARYGDGKYV